MFLFQNYKSQKNIEWGWVEENRVKLREMDRFIFIQEQGHIPFDDPTVIDYITSAARRTVTVMNFEEQRFSRQYDLWTSRLSPKSIGICEEILVDPFTLYNNLRKFALSDRLLPLTNPPGHILPRLRSKRAPFQIATHHELMNDLFWQYW